MLRWAAFWNKQNHDAEMLSYRKIVLLLLKMAESQYNGTWQFCHADLSHVLWWIQDEASDAGSRSSAMLVNTMIPQNTASIFDSTAQTRPCHFKHDLGSDFLSAQAVSTSTCGRSSAIIADFSHTDVFHSVWLFASSVSYLCSQVEQHAVDSTCGGGTALRD